MSNLYFEVPGNVTIAVLVTEINDSSLMFDITIPNSGEPISMIEQIKFNLDDHNILGGISIKGMGNFAEKCEATGAHVGVRFDPTEVSIKEKNALCFVMSHADLNLTVDTVFGQKFDVQLAPRQDNSAVVDYQTDSDDEDAAPEAGMMGMLRSIAARRGNKQDAATG